MSPYLLIAAGAVAGANARYVVSLWAAERIGVDFPYGTFIINISGSFIMGGFLTGLGDYFHGDANAKLLVATGFLGAYTTFSTFTYETFALARRGAVRLAVVNVLGSVTAGVAGAELGLLLANLVGGR